MGAYKRIQTTDDEINRVQDSIVSALGPTQVRSMTVSYTSGGAQLISGNQINLPFESGNLVTVSLTTGVDNLVPHGLSRTLQVWVIAGQDTNTNVWSPNTSLLNDSNGNPQNSNESYLNLKCGANCNVKVWVS